MSKTLDILGHWLESGMIMYENLPMLAKEIEGLDEPNNIGGNAFDNIHTMDFGEICQYLQTNFTNFLGVRFKNDPTSIEITKRVLWDYWRERNNECMKDETLIRNGIFNDTWGEILDWLSLQEDKDG